MLNPWRRRVRRALARGVLFCGAVRRIASELSADPLIIPRNEGVRAVAKVSTEITADVGVGARVCDEDCVVSVPVLLPPALEDCLAPTVVRIERRHHAPECVVEGERADAGAQIELELM